MMVWIKDAVYRLIKPCIVFESRPILSDNTKPVYDELVRRGYNKKYRFVWYVDYDECASVEDGKLVYWQPRSRKTLKEKIRNYSYFYKTKCTICCNSFLSSSGPNQMTFGKGQICFYLSHGTPMKSVKAYYTSRGGIDYMLSPAKALEPVMSYEFSVEKDRIFSAGFPRNDTFSRAPIDLNGKLGYHYKKIIIWYPTYRQNSNHSVETKGDSMPLIYNNENALHLNSTAKDNNVLILLKPHFAQDVSLIHMLDLSNIKLIDDTFFEEKGFSSYEMLAASDALLTDYSSVYFDYTLRDKPIGVIWEDIDSYREFPGFALDLDYYLKGAEKIYTIEQLCAFVENVAQGIDRLQEERREIRDVTNYSLDGKNTERVVDFIVEKAGL